jgi:uncharacterized protein with PIN domain
MARFYSNENIAQDVVVELRSLGHDVLTSSEAGNANQAVPDDQVLRFATAEGRILLSHNRRHFLRLHNRATTPHCGIIVCTFDADSRALAARISAAAADAKDLTGRLVRVNRRVENRR